MSGHTTGRRPTTPQPFATGRGWFGATLALAGGALLFLGWWGVSGRATIGEQVPYLASGSIPGAALVVAGALVLTRDRATRAADHADAVLSELRALLTEDVPVDRPTGVDGGAPEPLLVTVPGNRHVHRAGCPLVTGKSGVEVVDAERPDLTDCPVCGPSRPDR